MIGSQLLCGTGVAPSFPSVVAELYSPERRIATFPSVCQFACFLGADGVGPATSAEVRRVAFLPAALAEATRALPFAAAYELILSPHVTAALAQRLPAELFRTLAPKLCYLPPVPPAPRRSSQADATGYMFICASGSTTAVVARSLRDFLPGPVVVHPPLAPVASLDWSTARHWRLYPEDDNDTSLDALLAAATAQGCTTEVLSLGQVCAATGFPTGTPIAQRSPTLRKLAQAALAPRPAPRLEPLQLQPVFSKAGLADRWQTLVERRLARPGGDDPGFLFPTDFLRPDQTTPSSATTLAQEFLERMQPWFDVARPSGAACRHLRLLALGLLHDTTPASIAFRAEIDELLGQPPTHCHDPLSALEQPLSGTSAALARLCGRTLPPREFATWRERLPADERPGFVARAVHSAVFGAAHLYRLDHPATVQQFFREALTVLDQEAQAAPASPASLDLQLQLALATAGPDASVARLRAAPAVAPLTPTVHAAHLAWFGHRRHAVEVISHDATFSAGDSLSCWLRGLALAVIGEATAAATFWRELLAREADFFSDATPLHPDFWLWHAFALEQIGATASASAFRTAAAERDILYRLKTQRPPVLSSNTADCTPCKLPQFSLACVAPAYAFRHWIPRASLGAI
jgi:hypothetical protein